MRRFAPAPFLAILFLSLSPPVEAAPYCVGSQGVPAQCIHHDVGQCRADARRMKGVCSLNASEVKLSGGENFCVVRNGPVVQCLYPDRRSCDQTAGREGGICVDSQGRAARPDPDRPQ